MDNGDEKARQAHMLGMWPGQSLHAQRPPAGFLTIRIASSIHFSVSSTDTKREPSGAAADSTFSSMSPPSLRHSGAKGLRGERAAAERGGRGPLLPGRREKARHPGAICGRTQASRISKRRLEGEPKASQLRWSPRPLPPLRRQPLREGTRVVSGEHLAPPLSPPPPPPRFCPRSGPG